MTEPSEAGAAPRRRAEEQRSRFRRATSRYATGIAVVTTRADGLDHAMTANSFTSVSLDPLLALVCVERESRFHAALMAAPAAWAVSFLPAGSGPLARWFATKGRPLLGQFEGVPVRRGESGCLLLASMLAGLELRTEQVVAGGDHDVVLGAVTAIHEPIVDPDGASPGAADPTVYYASRFWHLA